MDLGSAFVAAFALLVSSIVIYRVVEAVERVNLPPAGPKSDFQVLTETIEDELIRLHSELNNISSGGEMYASVIKEIGRLNQQLIDLYNEQVSKNPEVTQ